MAARKSREPEIAGITGLTHEGRGVADVPGKKVFVERALPGETVRFVRRRRRKSFDEADLEAVIEPAPARVEPRCPVFGVCGGCALQHLAPAAQLAEKERQLLETLERIGGVTPAARLPALSGPVWNYRRRARLGVKHVERKGRTLVGFRERDHPYITDMHACPVLAPPGDALIDPLSALVGDLSIRRRLPQIELAIGDAATALVLRVLDPPDEADLAALAVFARERDVDIHLQTGGPDTVRPLPGTTPRPLWYEHPAFGVRLEFGPTDFVQVNAELNRRLVEEVLRQLEPRADDSVLDLYCGLGNFTLPLARRAGRVLGIEGDPALIERARANAAANGIDNAGFRVADLANLDGGEDWLDAGWDLVLLDPARAGAAAISAAAQRTGARRIVYVSCHPGTLARDAGMLVAEQGYRLAAAGVADMFPHTAHVESVSVFDRV